MDMFSMYLLCINFLFTFYAELKWKKKKKAVNIYTNSVHF